MAKNFRGTKFSWYSPQTAKILLTMQTTPLFHQIL